MTNSDNSRRSSLLEIVGICLCLLTIASLFAGYSYSSGYLLYYGDAQAHLNISRSLIDSRQPGYEQLGTVWLPVLHLLALPFVKNDLLWSTGLAGTIPLMFCFVVSGVALYLSGKETFYSSGAAFVGVLCFALNPNVLYLATITMSEIAFVAGLAVCLLALLRFRRTQSVVYIALAVAASWWLSLTRYDGWFLIPFVGLFLSFAADRNKLRILIVTLALAALAPLYWLGHNWWETGNPLDFYNGPYSAAAIQGAKNYPGFHDWAQAIHYYSEAGRACCGNALLLLGIAGLIVAVWKGRWLAVSFLSLTPLFYVWSVHSSKTPIHLPWLWPHGYYNSRYGIAVVVLMSFACSALASSIPRRLLWIIPLVALLPWMTRPGPDAWICWKESQRNSLARRAWTERAATYLNQHYREGDGLLTEFGDLAGVFCRARLPLREAVHEGSGPTWFANTMPSGLVRQTKWAMAQDGDWLWRRLASSASFRLVEKIEVEGAPALCIYERRHLGETP